MAASMKSILKRATEFFQNLEKKKLIMLISLAVVIIAAGIIGAVLLNQVKYTVLFSSLDAEEAGTIKTVLDEQGVTSKVQGTGTILVPEEQADELRIQLAAQGYPNSGLNYDTFSNSSALGSTDLERRTYLTYQLQDNISTALKHMDKVQNAIVLVTLASDSSFVISDNLSEASVGVYLKLRSDDKLTSDEAKTIGEFVKSCVPGLKPENISIVDSQMNYYDVNTEDGDSATPYSTSQQELTERIKETLSEQVRAVLEPAFGKEGVAVSVNPVLNFDQETINSIEFSTPIEGETEGLLRSAEEIRSAVGTTDTANGSAGTDTNGEGTPAYVAEDTTGTTETNSTTTYNYELNELQTEIKKAMGTLEDLSVAVLLNSNIEGADAQIEKVKNLTAQAIGVEPEYISVELMPFVDNTTISDALDANQATIDKESQRDMIVRIIEVVVIAAAVVFIIRLFLAKPKHQAAQPLAVASGAGAIVGLTHGEGDAATQAETFDLSDLMLKKSSEAERIEELMDRYPETVAQILRSWIAEDI